MTWLVVGVVVVLAAVVAAMLRDDDSFQTAASELGLKLSRTVPDLLPRLDGIVDGLPVKVDVVEQRQPQLRYRVFYPELGIALRLERETTITRTLGQLGSGDQQVGAKPFDDSFRVNTSRPDALRTMMTPQLRRTLIGVIERHPAVVIGDGEITITDTNLNPAAETLVATVREMVGAATGLVANRPPAVETPSVRISATEPSDTDATHADVPGTDSAIAELPPEVSPTDPAKTVRAVESPDEAQPVLPAEADSGLPDDFFENVFGDNRLSFEEEDTFERKFRGTEVALAGTVKQSSSYPGSEARPNGGTKAVITVAQIETELYGKNDIDAAVYLAGVAPAELGRGDRIKFNGTLESVDPFMRTVVVADARLQT